MKKKVLLLCGCPGSGKSYWATKTFLEEFGQKYSIAYISRDEIRFSLLKDKDDYFARENEVWDTFVDNIVEGINTTDIIIVDQTNLYWGSRRKIINAIKNVCGNPNYYEFIPVIFHTPYNVCVKRNSQREGRKKVPEDQLRRMWNAFNSPKTDPYVYRTMIDIYYAEGDD